jgi:ABC-type polysaccharide/polyol phosphate transport system ATPase subunit
VAGRRIEFRGVRKSFRVRSRSDALRDAIPRLLGRLAGRGEDPRTRFVALDDVSFHVDDGEVLGIVGANGAGKSTALRLTAGIYRADSGTVDVRGRVSALIELTAGFHPDLSGRENIFLVGALLGMRRGEVDRLVGPIAEFADIGEFLESPVRMYSTGMAVRLGFSVAAHVPADVLLVDEVLAVGDIEFRARCLERMAELKGRGVAVLFVSHHLDIMERFCDRVLFIHHGRVLAEGEPRGTLDAYRRKMAEGRGVPGLGEGAAATHRKGTGEIRLEDVVLDGGTDGPDAAVRAGGTLRIRAKWAAERPVREPRFGVVLHTPLGERLVEATAVGGVSAPAVFEGRGALEVRFEALPLLPGTYEVSVYARDSSGLVPYDHHQRFYVLKVEGSVPAGVSGLIATAPSWRFAGGNG